MTRWQPFRYRVTPYLWYSLSDREREILREQAGELWWEREGKYLGDASLLCAVMTPAIEVEEY